MLLCSDFQTEKYFDYCTHAFGYIHVFLSVGAHICASVIQLRLLVGHLARLNIDSSILQF